MRKASDLRGKLNEPIYTKALNELWRKLWIVGFGEVDDGAFPSLAIGATSVLFEDLWQKAKGLKSDTSEKALRAQLGEDSLFYKSLLKLRLPVEATKRNRLHLNATLD